MYYKSNKAYTQGYTSPRGGKRGCLCPETLTYNKNCCNGNLINQGIGALTGQNG